VDKEKEVKKVEETPEGEKKGYKVKKKPELKKDQIKKLILRRNIKKRTPVFLREEWFRYKRITKNWRRPDGITSKMRKNLKYRPSKVRVGFRGPKETRDLHSSGFQEVVVNNVYDLEIIDPKIQAARIGSSVGTKKRLDIKKKAEELDIRILNL
jgi:large subunit ribosomal protein L32e